MLIPKEGFKGQYEIVIKEEQEVNNNNTHIKNKRNPRLYAKSELLTWVPYMVATKGDAGILNIPRENNFNNLATTTTTTTTSDISSDAIIPTSSTLTSRHQLKRKTTTTKKITRRLTRSARKT